RLFADALTIVNKPEEAFAQYNRVLNLNPDDWQTHLNLANLAAEFDSKLALHHAEIAYRLRPEVYESNQNYAEALVHAGEYDRALEMFEKLQRGLPQDNPLQAVLAERMERIRVLKSLRK
ncbi:MAG: tetratricopeptide repeat protein, partial [Phycisphaerae bacterium]